MRALLALLVAAATVTACGADPGVGDERAAQARQAALDAGLPEDVADFLGLAARGQTATYRATYPGPSEGTELVVANRPPDRRVDVVVGDRVTEVRLVLDGEAFACARDDELDAIEECTRTDAFVDGPGLFGPDALETLTASLEDRLVDFTFSIETVPVAGVEATCLVTRLRDDRDRPELGDRGSMCVSARGALLRVEQADEMLEAIDYSTDVPDDTFVRPDLTADD